MQVSVRRTMEVTLTLTGEEAQSLMGLMQNPLVIMQDPQHEGAEVRNMRMALFTALSNGLRGEGAGDRPPHPRGLI